MSGTIPPLPQYALMAWCSVKTQGQLYLYLSYFHFPICLYGRGYVFIIWYLVKSKFIVTLLYLHFIRKSDRSVFNVKQEWKEIRKEGRKRNNGNHNGREN
jgi:hypothetical protein